MTLDLTKLPYGWFTDLDCQRLYYAAVDAPLGAFVEIGVYRGRSASVLAQADPARELWLFDSCADVGVREGDWPRGPHIHHRLRALGSEDAERIGNIAVLHIDGNHSYAGVLFDLTTLGPSVVVDGRIILHDFQQPNADDKVGRAVEHAWLDWPGHADFEPIFAFKEQAGFRRVK